jgi:endoglucanase
MMSSLWESYKKDYLEAETYRTLDKERNFITTSEGQSYTMLRAVWMDDQDTFNKSWGWTKDNLQRKNDHLFSWLFGKKEDGAYGVLSSEGGENSASDADVDIAFALLLAHSRWGDDVYKNEALLIINDVWEKEVVEIAGKPYLAANNLEKFSSKDSIVANPSYYAPYAYRWFAEVDKTHPWQKLVDASFEFLGQSAKANLGKNSSSNLPPNWVLVNKKTGQLVAGSGALNSDFSFDALRTPWRLALDYEWFKDPRAKAVLDEFVELGNAWREKNIIYAMTHDGEAIDHVEIPALYGGAIGYFMYSAPTLAKDVYEKKMQMLYSPDMQTWKQPLGYYNDNWMWFGMALYNHMLKNFNTP